MEEIARSSILGGLGLVIGIIILVYRLNNKGGTKSDQRANQYGYALLIWAIFLLLSFIPKSTSLISIATNVALIACTPLLLLPSLLSALIACFGRVKLSYYIGKLGFFYFGRNPTAGGLLRGYQAAKTLKNVEHQREALLWLRSRYQKHTGKIYSGEMVMYIIIDALLTKPNDDEYLAQRLNLLDGIGQSSIPRGVSVLACKLALIPALSRGDWDAINDIAEQWNTPASNGIAKYLKEFYGRYVKYSHVFSKFDCWFWSLVIFRNKDIMKLSRDTIDKLKERENSFEPEASFIESLWINNNKKMSEVEKKNQLESLLANHVIDKWKNRASTIGVLQIDNAWDAIERSVHQHPQFKIDHDCIEDDEQYERKQSLQKNLRYLEGSIQRKLSEKLPGSGFEHYMDWLKVLNILHELKTHKHEQLLAFSIVHNVLWNWAADLWNNKKERCLVHFIATVCAPLALECNFKEMHKILSGITRGEFK